MTQYGDPYENILAERINKTMKEEFLDVFLFLNFEEAKYFTAKAIRTYNRKRPILFIRLMWVSKERIC